MAGIDKTYVNKEQLKEAVEWAKNIGVVTLENGHKFKPLDWIESYNDIYNPEFWNKDYKEYILWNTPYWLDRWLWCNCELLFVRDSLMDVYSDDTLDMIKNWKYTPTPKERRKYVFVKEPSPKKYWKCFSKHKHARWEFHIMLPNALWQAGYDEQTKEWHECFEMLPAYDDYFWFHHHKHLPNKKTILRVLRKWNLPKGTRVTLSCFRYGGLDFEIVVK
jgi:hypothetical protein